MNIYIYIYIYVHKQCTQLITPPFYPAFFVIYLLTLYTFFRNAVIYISSMNQ